MGSSHQTSPTSTSIKLTTRTSSDLDNPPKSPHLVIPTTNSPTLSPSPSTSRRASPSRGSSPRPAPLNLNSHPASASSSSNEDLPTGSEPDDNIGEGSPMLAHGGVASSEEDSWSEPDVGPETPGLPPNGFGHHRASSVGSNGRRSRKVYGGNAGVGDVGYNLSAVQCAGLLWAATLGPTPLLLPSAVAALGVPLFFVLLGIIAGLSWFAYVVLGVEARYVGARSYPALAASVFPSFAHLHHLGAVGASILISALSLLRGLAVVLAVAEVGGQTALAGRAGRIAWVASTAASWAILPLLVPPVLRRVWPMDPRPSTTASKAIARGPFILACVLWPLALLVLGVRLKHLPDSPPQHAPPAPQDGHATAWRAVALIVGAMGAHHDAFTFIFALARPSSTATRGRGGSRINSGTAASATPGQEGKRNQWPLAAFLGVAAALAVQVGWALVGYLAVPADADEGGQIALGGLGNILNSPRLPTSDGWLQCVRFLVLGALLCGVEGAMSPAMVRFGKLVRAMVARPGSAAAVRRRTYARVGGGGGADAEGSEWIDAVARLAAWLVVMTVALALEIRGQGDLGLLTASQVAGVGAALVGMVGPSLFFLVLFHLRRPRSIFVSDTSLPAFAGDALLLRKERAVQRRLTGRRIWMDAGVGLALLPVGVVVLVRGGGAMMGWE